MGPDRPAAVRRLPLRRRLPRSRVPLHRRIRQDPAGVRHWLLVGALAWLLASVVGHALDRAEAARERWGPTEAVWVADRPVRTGDRIDGAVRAARWPAALVPDAAVSQIPSGARAAGPIDPGTAITGAVIGDGRRERRTVAVPLGDARLPVREGDRVDVWATGDPATATDGRAAARRVASGARVASASDRSVVLEVDPAQVERLAAAAATATITLVGR